MLTVGNKMHKAFPLPVEVPTASEESCHCQKKREATAVKIALLLKSKKNRQSKSDDSYTNGSQIKFEYINQIDEDDMKEMDIKWNLALLSMRADKFWKKTGKKISIQGTDVAGFDKSKVECFNCHKTGHFTRECRAPRSQDRGRRDNYRQGSKVKEHAPKVLMAIDGELETLKKEKEGLDGKLAAFQTASKDLDSLLKSQRLDKKKEGLRYSVVPPPPTQIYSSPKKDTSWTGLPEFKDNTVTDYSRPTPTVESFPDDAQNRNPYVTEEASPSTISPKSFIKFVKANESPTKSKIDKAEKAKKSPVKYTEQYKKPTKKPNGSSQNNFNDKGYWDSRCSWHMTGNISYLSDFEPFDGGYVSFGQGGCKITGKGTIKTSKLEFENVYFVKDLKTPRLPAEWTFFLKTKDETSGILRKFI
nr:ribonuclease H-like domain-containing protein [Tanacetum cinerariifolium]